VDTLVAVFTAVTLTPGINAPELSDTVPLIAALLDCPKDGFDNPGQSSINAPKKVKIRPDNLRECIVSPPLHFLAAVYCGVATILAIVGANQTYSSSSPTTIVHTSQHC
jgi:hypothetical protein